MSDVAVLEEQVFSNGIEADPLAVVIIFAGGTPFTVESGELYKTKFLSDFQEEVKRKIQTLEFEKRSLTARGVERLYKFLYGLQSRLPKRLEFLTSFGEVVCEKIEKRLLLPRQESLINQQIFVLEQESRNAAWKVSSFKEYQRFGGGPPVPEKTKELVKTVEENLPGGVSATVHHFDKDPLLHLAYTDTDLGIPRRIEYYADVWGEPLFTGKQEV